MTPRGIYRSRRRGRAYPPKPLPKNHFTYYMITCPHCHEVVFVRVSDLHGIYGRVFECVLCKLQTRAFKRTRSFEDQCKVCIKPVLCMSTPIIQVGTGTKIKGKEYTSDELNNRIMATRLDIC